MLNRIALILAAALLASPAWAQSQNCTLKQLAYLDMTTTQSGHSAIPVKVGGTQKKFLVEIGDIATSITTDYSDMFHPDAAKLLRKNDTRYFNSSELHRDSLPDIEIGSLTIKSPPVLVYPRDWIDDDKDVAGVIGLDILSRTDVEIDLAHNKLKLFMQDHCPNLGAYWAKDYVALPIETDRGGGISVKMGLDGKDVTVGFSLRFEHGTMSYWNAYQLHNFLTQSPYTRDSSGYYHYPFKALSTEGITISNPAIDIGADSNCDGVMIIAGADRNWQCHVDRDLFLGRSILRQLHLYFAFKEKLLYVTAADAHN